MSGNTITVDVAGLDQTLREVKAMPGRIRGSARAAIAYTVRRTRRDLAAAMAKEVGTAQRLMLRRVKAMPMRDRESGVWIGLDAVPAHTLGKPTQGAQGVMVGDRYYRGAFVSAIYSKQKKIWIRLHSRHFNLEQYPYSPRAHRLSYDADHRFPVVLARVRLDTPAIDRLIESGALRAQEILRSRFLDGWRDNEGGES